MIYLYLVCIIFVISIFFEDLLIPIGIKSWSINMSFLLCIICFVLTLIIKKQKFVSYIIDLIKNKSGGGRIYGFFVLYVFIITTIMMLLGKVKFLIPYLGLFLIFIFLIGISLIVSSYISYKVINPKSLVKILYISLFVVLLLGIVDYLLTKNGILISGNRILSIFYNKDILIKGAHIAHAEYDFKIRAQSIYWEPGYFSEYIFFFVPFLYSISFSKYKIFENNYLNCLIKKLAVPLYWINIYLAKSPLWITVSIIFTVIYFMPILIKQVKKSLLKSIAIGVISIISLLFMFISFRFVNENSITFNNSAFERINVVASNLTSINELIQSEQSLGTRLCCILNSYNVGLKSPLWGIGHGNLINAVSTKIYKGQSIVFVPAEVWGFIRNKDPFIITPISTYIFVHYGLIGMLLFYGFIINIIVRLMEFAKYFQDLNKNILHGFSGMLICYIISSFYDFSISCMLPIYVIGFSLGLTMYYSRKIKTYKMVMKNK